MNGHHILPTVVVLLLIPFAFHGPYVAFALGAMFINSTSGNDPSYSATFTVTRTPQNFSRTLRDEFNATASVENEVYHGFNYYAFFMFLGLPLSLMTAYLFSRHAIVRVPERLKKHGRLWYLRLISFLVSGYVGGFSFLMSSMRVIKDSLCAGEFRANPYVINFNDWYGMTWRVNFSIGAPMTYSISLYVLGLLLTAFIILQIGLFPTLNAKVSD